MEYSLSAQILSADLPMLDVYMPMLRSSALISAGRLGLFEALSRGAREAASLARELGASERGVAVLADFLVQTGYLERSGDLFANTPFAAQWFTRGGKVDYSPGLDWSGFAWEIMTDLPETSLWQRMVERPEMGSAFSRYMHAFACHLTDDLLDAITLPEGARRLLDLGGAHGLHSISFCERHPELSAVIVDLETALAATQDLIDSKGVADRIQLKPGDLNASVWGDDYDVVFYLSVAHNQSPQDNRAIFRRIGEAMRAGGLLVIHEYLSDSPSPFHAAFQLTLLSETGTRLYSQTEIENWLAEAGFDPPRRIDLLPRDKGSLLISRYRERNQPLAEVLPGVPS